jgi:hypothetical protein
MVENVVLVFNKRQAKHEENPRRAAKCLLALLGAKESLDKVVASTSVEQVLFLPLHIDEVLLRWHEEIEQSLNELGLFHHILQSSRGQQVPL